MEVNERGASIAGTLQAENIQSNSIETSTIKTKQGDVDERLSAIAATASGTMQHITYQTTIVQEATKSNDLLPALTEEWNASISAILAKLEKEKVESAPIVDMTGKELKVDSIKTYKDMTVYGATNLGDTTIAGSISIDAIIKISKNGLETITDTLYLQKSKLANLDFMAGTMLIDTLGNVTIHGNLTINGNVSITGTLGVSDIKASSESADIAITLGDKEATPASLQIKNALKELVAEINASGSAKFTKLNMTESAVTPATDSAITENKSSVGSATLEAYATEISIDTTAVTDTSLIYVTPVSSTGNKVLYVKRKDTTKGFTVALDQPIKTPIIFNWWIIN